MSGEGTSPEARKREQLHADLWRERAQREKGYRERALRLFPHLCASCGREFEGRRLRELTVHHRDHNHNNNPPDGSNWELLCLYCHDHEHEKFARAGHGGGPATPVGPDGPPIANPFAGLDTLLGGGEDDAGDPPPR